MHWGDEHGWKFRVPATLALEETPRREGFNMIDESRGVPPYADAYQLVLRGNCSGISATFIELPADEEF